MTAARDGASVLHQLPLSRWATRLRSGRVELTGNLGTAISIPLGDATLEVSAGPVEVAFGFSGGDCPKLAQVHIGASRLGVCGASSTHTGRQLRTQDDTVSLDNATADVGEPPHRIARTVHMLTAALSDVVFDAKARPVGELLVRLPAGVHVVVPANDTLHARGASQGPPHALQLSEPLEVHAGGEGIRLSHRHFRWLARLARVRISVATLHPDGNVRLEGGASSGLDRAVRKGLRRTSSSLSSLVRTSPQFQRLRRFLKHGDNA